MFRTRRVLEEISATLQRMDARTDAGLSEVSATLRRMDARADAGLSKVSATLRRMDARTDAGLSEVSETVRRMDARMDRELKLARASVESNTQVTREILLELREQRPILERIDHGVHANTEGLLHVLDELRDGRGGPGTAPAA